MGWGVDGEDDHHGDCAGGVDGRKEERAAGVGVGPKPAPPEGDHLLSAGSDACVSHLRLSHTKAAVKAALADDFDTPGAVAAVLDLIHQANRQLKVVTKVTPVATKEGFCLVGFPS